jgi:hypothetical protein
MFSFEMNWAPITASSQLIWMEAEEWTFLSKAYKLEMLT